MSPGYINAVEAFGSGRRHAMAAKIQLLRPDLSVSDILRHGQGLDFGLVYECAAGGWPLPWEDGYLHPDRQAVVQSWATDRLLQRRERTEDERNSPDARRKRRNARKRRLR